MTLEDEAFRAIGQTVANAQFFEFALVVCAKLALGQEQAATLAEVSPLSESRSFKQPTKDLLRELRSKVNLTPEFEEKLSSVVEDRHELIHRWVVLHGWPESHDEPGLRVMKAFAESVSVDLNALTQILLDAIMTWLDKFPEMKNVVAPLGQDWRERLPEEFRRLPIRSSGNVPHN